MNKLKKSGFDRFYWGCALTIVILKAFGLIKTSWWLATLMLWAPYALIAVFLAVAVILLGVTWVIQKVVNFIKRKKGTK